MAAFNPHTLEQLGSVIGDELLSVLTLFRTEALSIAQQLTEALEQDDRKRVRLLAHSLKGSSSNLGANALLDCCKRLEDNALTGTTVELNGFLQELGVALDAACSEVAEKMTAAGRE